MKQSQNSNEITALVVQESPEMGPVLQWLSREGIAPSSMGAAVLAKLLSRSRHLPKPRQVAYVKTVLIGEFFTRWKKKHSGATFEQLQINSPQNEVRPFHMAMLAIADEKAFRKVLPRLARTKELARCSSSFGNATDFTCFATDYANVIGNRFLANFNPNVPYAATKAVKYIQVTAVSHYLYVGSKNPKNYEGLIQHLVFSKKLGVRCKLAAKLIYFPNFLTEKERRVLMQRYGATGGFARRMKVKDVAKLLRYPSAAVLSRKMYRLRQWDKSRAEREELS